jgi:hypothetical protein
VDAGGIAGEIADSGSLCNSEANVDIDLTDECGTVNAGGLVGFNNSGSICNCVTTGAVKLQKLTSTARGIGCTLIGGSIGGTITNCYSSGTGSALLTYEDRYQYHWNSSW